MILYAVKIGDRYLRDRHEAGWERGGLAKASVYADVASALRLRDKVKAETDESLTLLELTLSEQTIPWPQS